MKNNDIIDKEKLEDLLRKVFLENEDKQKKLKKIKAIMRKNKRRRIRRRIITISAPLAATAAVLIFWLSILNPSKSIDPNEFYKNHFQPESTKVTYRGTESPLNYGDTTSTLQESADQISLAKKAMVSENWQEADKLFKQLLPLEGSIQIESLWHLSLIQLKTGNTSKCKIYLEELIKTKDPTYIKQARTLLRVVNR